MSSSQFSRWCAVLLLVGCNAKLQVDPGASAGNGGADGRAGAGGSDAGSAPIDVVAGDGPGGYTDGPGGGDTGGVGGVFDSNGGAPTVAGASGSAGSPVVGPVPGQRGQSCVLGLPYLEAQGTPAQVTIKTLNRCANGLACDTTKHCSSIPPCPQTSGACVVHGVPLEDPGAGGTGGGAGGAPSAGAGGAGSVAVAPVSAEVGITALAADDTHLYWLDYGTRDALGNYQHDGALFSYSIADAKLTTLASDLPGPNALGITSGHAYVAVDGGPLIGSAPHAQLLRLPLTGGAAELVQDAVTAKLFASVGDQAFWASEAGVYTVSPTPGAVFGTFDGSTYLEQLATDASRVYEGGGGSIVSVPQTENAPSIVFSPPYTFALGADSVYGIETLGDGVGLVLDVVPKTGGAWTRQGALGAGGFVDRLQIIGDRYVFSASPPFPAGGNISGIDISKEYLETGSILSAPVPPVRLVEATGHFNDKPQRMLWVATAQAVFWSDRSAIFSRSLNSTQ